MRMVLFVLVFIVVYMVLSALGRKKETHVWIEGCEYLKIEEGIAQTKTTNYIPLNNCK